MISIFKCFKHSSIKINQNNKKFFTFPGAVNSYNLKSNALSDKLKEWYTKFFSPNEAKHLKDVMMKQQYLQKVQDERREIGKLITDVRKSFIEKQDKLLLINRWENVEQYVNLRKEEAKLIRKEHELTAKFESLDKIEKELSAVISNTLKCSYDKEKERKIYTKFWGAIISTVIMMIISIITNNSTNVEENPSYTINNIEIEVNEKAVLGLIGVGVMFIICGSCC